MRTCSRCGNEFDYGLTNQNVCANCRCAKKERNSVPGAALTQRQLQIAKLICEEGLTNREIAFRLHLSEGTVKVYITQIFIKTRQRDRLKLALYWRDHGADLS